jgi:hypothetical protein
MYIYTVGRESARARARERESERARERERERESYLMQELMLRPVDALSLEFVHLLHIYKLSNTLLSARFACGHKCASGALSNILHIEVE